MHPRTRTQTPVLTLLAVALCTPAVSQATPAMVTTARGAIQVVREGAQTAAPAPPFLLEEGQALDLPEGALVVVLFEGYATQVIGPARVDQASLKKRDAAPRESVSVLDEILSRQVSTRPTGASRGVGDLRLVRPVPGSSVLAPGRIAWRCDGCGAQQVQIYDILEDAVLWTGTGSGEVAYSGPDLGEGAYSVVVGGQDYAFTVAKADEARKASDAATAARTAAAALETSGADPASCASVVASVYLQANLPTEALYAIDAALAEHPGDAGLEALRATFESRAGLAP